MANRIVNTLWVVVVALIASLVAILMGILYFGITLWVIKVATNFFFSATLDANWAVLAAAIIATGAILAGALERKGD